MPGFLVPNVTRDCNNKTRQKRKERGIAETLDQVHRTRRPYCGLILLSQESQLQAAHYQSSTYGVDTEISQHGIKVTAGRRVMAQTNVVFASAQPTIMTWSNMCGH